jgi:hypothetical protein
MDINGMFYGGLFDKEIVAFKFVDNFCTRFMYFQTSHNASFWQ